MTGHVGGPAQVVLRARRDVAEDDFLGDAAAEQDVETVEQVQAGQEVAVLRRRLLGVAQRGDAARDDRDLVSTVAHREPLGVAHMEPVWRRDRIPDMTVVALPPTQRWCRASGAR